MRYALLIAAALAVAVGSFGCITVWTRREKAPSGDQTAGAAERQVQSEWPALVTKTAPDFEEDAVLGDNSFGKVRLSAYRGQYVILFFYPMDFTFVCPTEIIAFDAKLEEFEKRNCQVLGVSVDSHYTHLAWKNTPRDKGGIGKIRYPLVADMSKSISRAYGVLWDESVALRGLFLIDPKGVVRHALVNDLPLGRNVDEALRMLDAVTFVDTHGDEVCPANWTPGDRTVKTSFDGIQEYLSKQKAKAE